MRFYYGAAQKEFQGLRESRNKSVETEIGGEDGVCNNFLPPDKSSFIIQAPPLKAPQQWAKRERALLGLRFES